MKRRRKIMTQASEFEDLASLIFTVIAVREAE
jgi:hypothetical protein